MVTIATKNVSTLVGIGGAGGYVNAVGAKTS